MRRFELLVQHGFRQPHIVQHGADDPANGRQTRQRFAYHPRYEGEHSAVQAHTEFGGMPGFGEDVYQLAHAVVLGIGEVETAAVVVGLVGDVMAPNRQLSRQKCACPARHPPPELFYLPSLDSITKILCWTTSLIKERNLKEKANIEYRTAEYRMSKEGMASFLFKRPERSDSILRNSVFVIQYSAVRS